MELFRLLGTIAIDNTEANRALTDTTDRASDSESKLSSVFGKIGGAAVAVGKVVAAGLAAASTAIAAVAKESLDAYADYEQLVGGVDTLFKESSKKVQEYADIAYKTAGLSANEYMETVTSFSASLLQSLDGDTALAAEKANQAIINMSDNANKMGSSMESIQNAYNGFAKQNYTMLDNLKLGYGGTKEEMARLIKEASEMKDVQEELGVTVDANSMSFGNIVDAISVVQKNMDIMGTTSKEASSTISGSIASMKSAWKNLLVGLADDSQDIDKLIYNLGDTIMTVGQNVIPRIQIILKSIGGVIEKVMPQIVAKIPSILMDILPDLLNAAISMLTAIGNTIITQLPNAVNQIMGLLKSLIESQGVDVAGSFGSIFSSDFIDTMTEWIYYLSDIVVMTITDTASMLAEKIEPIKELFVNLGEAIRPLVETWINGLVVAFDTLLVIWNDVLLPAISLVIDIFTQLATTIVTAITPAIENISSKFQELQQFVSAAIQNYIVPTISMFIEMIQQLWQENQDKINLIGELFSTVFNAIAGIVAWFVDTFKNYIYPFLGWLVGIVQSNMDNIKAVFQSAFDIIGGIVQFFIALFKGDWQGMWEAVKGILQAGYEFIMNVFNLIKSFLTTIGSAIWSVVKNAFENVRLAIVNKINQAKASIDSVFTNIKNIISNKLTEAKNTVSTIFDNIKTAITNKITAAKDAVAGVIEKIKGLFSFEWSLPDIKTPHFSIDPAGWKLSDLLEGVIPKLGIEWYAKGGVLTQPTIFGMNGNNAMIGGEAGAEAIAPIDVLQGYVAQAVASQNQGLVDVLSKILDAIMNMDENMGGNLRYALNGMEFKANEREFARLVKAVR